jgi:hypothetical protein
MLQGRHLAEDIQQGVGAHLRTHTRGRETEGCQRLKFMSTAYRASNHRHFPGKRRAGAGRSRGRGIGIKIGGASNHHLTLRVGDRRRSGRRSEAPIIDGVGWGDTSYGRTSRYCRTVCRPAACLAPVNRGYEARHQLRRRTKEPRRRRGLGGCDRARV